MLLAWCSVASFDSNDDDTDADDDNSYCEIELVKNVDQMPTYCAAVQSICSSATVIFTFELLSSAIVFGFVLRKDIFSDNL